MPSAVAALRLLLLTGCRLSEIQFLRWEYVKDDCIELPDAKTGGTDRAARSGGPRRAGSPAPRGGQSLGHPRQTAGHPSHRSPAPLAPHPRARRARRTCAFMTFRHSGMLPGRWRSGESLTMIGKLLGHTQVQTTARYAHLGAGFHPERRGADHREHRWKSVPRWRAPHSRRRRLICPSVNAIRVERPYHGLGIAVDDGRHHAGRRVGTLCSRALGTGPQDGATVFRSSGMCNLDRHEAEFTHINLCAKLPCNEVIWVQRCLMRISLRS